ncbi:sigma-70 family RNA polymerase sigma factor [Sphingomonadaceae bacterium OTU29LAMAA1]|uniref:sigma-70 family RNA polymerase sigma factor n=1 Tax=Sphingomonas sp. Leaf37 TaxID=2876552 RepID=UPI001E479343|nr:sigma-70 family RNA polymerase sigma factor [Sphingomonas sp. Leaf37]USU06008.1 sigma-70 family RNA polymerase sigma factor [Sphingomonadaceae bacterium OTU29LAMAA1]
MTIAASSYDVLSERGFVSAINGVLPALRRYARHLTRDQGDGDDLVQETMTRAWAARTRFQPGTNFRAWLFRILRNLFLSDRRRNVRNVSWNPDLDDDRLTTPADQESGVMLADLDTALGSITPGQAEALMLVAHEGLSYEEAASRLGVPMGTVRSRVFRARVAVVELLTGTAAPAESDSATPAASSERYLAWKQAGTRMIG